MKQQHKQIYTQRIDIKVVTTYNSKYTHTKKSRLNAKQHVKRSESLKGHEPVTVYFHIRCAQSERIVYTTYVDEVAT